MEETNDLRWLVKMVGTILIATAMIVIPIVCIASLNGCSPNPTENGWTLVGYAPGEPPSAIYKKHDDKEKVTYYATRSYADRWIVSVVKD